MPAISTTNLDDQTLSSFDLSSSPTWRAIQDFLSRSKPALRYLVSGERYEEGDLYQFTMREGLHAKPKLVTRVVGKTSGATEPGMLVTQYSVDECSPRRYA